MAIRVRSIPVMEEFVLKSDPKGETRIKIRQATFGEDALREQVFANMAYSWNDAERGTTRQEVKWTDSQLMQKEIFLTLCDANFEVEHPTKKDEDGNPKVEPLFRFAVIDGVSRPSHNEVEFSKLLGLLEGPVVQDIWQCVREVNKHWQPAKN